MIVILSRVFHKGGRIHRTTQTNIRVSAIDITDTSSTTDTTNNVNGVANTVHPPTITNSFCPTSHATLGRLVARRLSCDQRILRRLRPALPTKIPGTMVIPRTNCICSNATTLTCTLLRQKQKDIAHTMVIKPARHITI